MSTFDLRLNADGTMPLYPDLVTGIAKTVQAIKIALQLWEGEYVLDLTAGLNIPAWIEDLFRDLDAIGDEIRNEILDVSGVVRIENFQISKTGRLVSFSAHVYITDDAVTISGEFGIDEQGNRRALVWDAAFSRSLR